jgi:hypothetical protein
MIITIINNKSNGYNKNNSDNNKNIDNK